MSGSPRDQGAVRTILVFLFLLALAVPSPGAAQADPARGGQELSRQEMQTRIVQQFERRLARELRMDRAQLEQVQQVQHSLRQERRALYIKRRDLDARVRKFASEGGTNERVARALLAEARALRAEEARIEAEEEARLLELLSPSQVLRFGVMRQELNERIRRMHQGSDTVRRPSEPDRRRGPGGPGAAPL